MVTGRMDLGPGLLACSFRSSPTPPAGATLKQDPSRSRKVREPRPPRPKAEGTQSLAEVEGAGAREKATVGIQVSNDSGLDQAMAVGWRNVSGLKTHFRDFKGQGVALGGAGVRKTKHASQARGRRSRGGAAETNLARIHEDAGLIPDLAQWAGDPGLP